MVRALDFKEIRLSSSSSDGRAVVECELPEGGFCTFETHSHGKYWAGTATAVVGGYVETVAILQASPLTDMLQDAYMNGTIGQRIVPKLVSFADPSFVFDVEICELDAMLADVQLPPEAYDADGNLIIRWQPVLALA